MLRSTALSDLALGINTITRSTTLRSLKPPSSPSTLQPCRRHLSTPTNPSEALLNLISTSSSNPPHPTTNPTRPPTTPTPQESLKSRNQKLMSGLSSTLNLPRAALNTIQNPTTTTTTTPSSNPSPTNPALSFSSQFKSHLHKYHQDSPPPHILHLSSSRNNTIATLTDPRGNVLVWASSGTCGLKKGNRGTPDAGYQVVLQVAEKAAGKGVGLENGVEVRLKGFGAGREMGFKAVRSLGWVLKRVTDVTPVRHAGCRPPAKRRL
ncbi:hypothetical protein HDV05_008028 [Chytridiales sp. JEL 0842]|nr:hypothetical protein HDV05_008028 [Chytridiales sp. JEL 0842]